MMKTCKNLLLIVAFIGIFNLLQAQRTVVRTYPKQGTVVTVVQNPKRFVFKKTNFFFADGIWYRAQGRKYVVVQAPTGIQVRKLPRGNKIALVNGRKLYHYKGIWYKKTGRHFVVVNV
ncbi:MAG: DUF6515 family protein [Bacteroidota bacterium]